MPFGFLTLAIGGVPFYYYDGIYYQPAGDGYYEVYSPVGATIPEPPDGAIAIDAGGQTYYYAAGAFYLQQPDGTYAIVPARWESSFLNSRPAQSRPTSADKPPTNLTAFTTNLSS